MAVAPIRPKCPHCLNLYSLSAPYPQCPTTMTSVEVPGPLPVTPKCAQQVVLSSNVPCSSSPSNYEMDLDGLPVTVCLTHRKSDREQVWRRPKHWLTLQTEFECLKEEMEGLLAWKKEQDEFIAGWETYNCIAQAINDLVKIAVLDFPGDNLACVRPIWDKSTKGYKNWYLPHLLTNWWLASHFAGEGYRLPECLIQFTEKPLPYGFDSFEQAEMPSYLSDAAACLWECFEPQLELMLRLHWAQPMQHNNLQHPVPMPASAESHLRKLLSAQEMKMVSPIIEAGTKMEHGQQSFLFKHGNRREVTDTNHSLCEALGLFENVGVGAAENESTKGEKRKNGSEGEDDDRAGKRPKWES